jgi:hypothetical protein
LSIRSTAGRLGHELVGVAGFKPAMSKKEINIQLEKAMAGSENSSAFLFLSISIRNRQDSQLSYSEDS